MDYTNTIGICLRAGHFDLTSKLSSLLYLASLPSDPWSRCPSLSQSSSPGPVRQPKSAEQTWKKCFQERVLTFYQLHYFLILRFYIYYLHNTTRLSFLTPLITIVDTSLHRFMSLKHQSSGSFNSSSSSHYSSCIFACYTDVRKLVGKRGLKPHKAVLFHSLQFNQNRHRSKTNPQLNFLQAKYWTKKKKKARLWQAFMTTSSSAANILHLHHY